MNFYGNKKMRLCFWHLYSCSKATAQNRTGDLHLWAALTNWAMMAYSRIVGTICIAFGNITHRRFTEKQKTLEKLWPFFNIFLQSSTVTIYCQGVDLHHTYIQRTNGITESNRVWILQMPFLASTYSATWQQFHKGLFTMRNMSFPKCHKGNRTHWSCRLKVCLLYH